MGMEQTLVMIKPDGVERGLIGEILARFEKRGYKIVQAKLLNAQKEMVEEHYHEHLGKDFYPDLLAYILEGPVFVMILQGESMIEVTRSMIGDKNPVKAVPGTIRGDYANNLTKNIIHASDSVAAARKEIAIWFR